MIILFVLGSIIWDICVTKPAMRESIEDIRIEVKDIHKKLNTKFVNDTIDKTIKYLQEQFPRDEEVYIHIAENYDCVVAPNGTRGFGVYVPETRMIFIAGDVPDPETTLIETISHEYKHFLQHS